MRENSTVHPTPTGGAGLDPESAEWVQALADTGPQREAALEAVADAVAQPDTQGVPAHEEFPREVIKAAERDFAVAGVLRYAALRDGVIAAAPASTWPRASRSSPARRPFPRTAVVTTQPGSKSQQNAQRQGFDLLYTRAILVKQP